MKNFSLKKHGFEVKRGFISEQLISEILDETNNIGKELPVHGIRNADKKLATIARLCENQQLIHQAQTHLDAEVQVVRVIFFDKTPEKNWLVSWHQDKTVAVSDTFNRAGWGPWSIKDNTHHVQPPLSVLNQMVTFRIHLDSADRNNGCLKVISASNYAGLLRADEIKQWVQDNQPVYCEVNAGDAVIMRPHILHASSKSLTPKHRRVVHVEYSSHQLPQGVSWA